MCIIIDINTLSHVFQKDDAKHSDFEPVLNWIYNGKGIVVYGGTEYLSEIPRKYLSIFASLRKANKAKLIPANIVDIESEFAKRTIIDPDFDDPHLVGLLRASGCKLICSLDARAYPFFKHQLFFSPAKNKPKIYSSKSNKYLLSDKFIADICLPCSSTTNIQRAIIGTI